MSERDDQSIDHELSGVAMAATHEHEQTVSANETEAALDAVRSRIAGGDLGGAPPSIPLTSSARQRSPWVRFGAIAAAVAMVALGLVAVVGDGNSNDVITPITVPATPVAPTAPATTEITTVPEPETTTSTTTTPGSTFEQPVIAVDALDPPRLVEPVPYISLPLEPNPEGRLINFAVGSDHVVVNQPGTGTITIVGPDGDGFSAREVAVEEDIGPIASGPGPVVYALGELAFDEGEESQPRGLRLVAIPFLGANEGKVVAVEEVALALETPPSWLGHGPDGIIFRGQPADTEIGYVDAEGQSRDSGESAENGVPFPILDFTTGTALPAPPERNTITVQGADVGWQLEVSRDPDWGGFPFVGRNVVAPGAERAIYAERIGAAAVPGEDFSTNEMPVVALLNYDGTGEWIRLPDDWDVVASDVWGTLLARITDDSIELASLEDLVAPTGPLPPVSTESDPTSTATTAAPTATVAPPAQNGDTSLVQPTAIVRTCVGEFIGCTQLANTQNGRIVGLDPAAGVLRVYNPDGTELQAEVTIAEALESPQLWSIGPDDVAYVQTLGPESGESASELLAIPLIGSSAGSVVMRWTGLSTSGDNTLIPRKAGLTSVGCCGPKETRPTPDATIYRWVDRNGEPVESTAPSFDLNLGDAGNSVTRIETAPDGSPSFTPFTLPLAFQYPRDFPWITATDDGGALAFDQVAARSGSVYVLVDFDTDWPGANVDNGDIYYQPEPEFSGIPLLEPSGTVIVLEGAGSGQFVRRSLDEVATRGWPGRVEIDLDTGSAAAPGLNDYIAAEQPFWAGDPELLAFQLAPALGDSEEVRIEFEGSEAPAITITTTGLLDDSAEATQLVVTTERADDGLLRFVSATYGFRCVPGRGHQDFSVDPCV
ncbi:MAG: hypothetical protein WA964_14975 [Ilumatobacter sp.]|uniref:hypothetical protein n=1 Tax=Ilumatobacter sp. TaxID=1967498 RepID=UPI003C796B3B